MSNESTDSSPEVENQRQLDREVRDMFSHLRQGQDHDEEGIRIITLAGTNTGATLKSDLVSDPRKRQHRSHGIKLGFVKEGEDEDDEEGETEDLGTLVNSNFQAVNNSIMLSGSFSSNDPGVRVEIYGDGDEPRRSKLQTSPEEGENTKGKGRRYQPIVGTSK